jgi:hypothetical protein
MTLARSLLLAAAGASLLALAACGEEQQAAESTPPPAAEAPAEPPPAEDRTSTDDALRQLREAAEATGRAVRDEAERLGERGREALRDAQPTLDRAGEIASQIGQSLSEIARQAMEDFEGGVAELERRIEEADENAEPITGDPQARLAPADQLRADTRAAARAQPAGVGPDYVGVWAQDAASCARIDQEPVEMFAVITTTTIRRYEAMCNFAAEGMVGESVVLDASCVSEGDLEERPIAIDMPSPDTLRIGTPEAPGTADLVRCHLPE